MKIPAGIFDFDGVVIDSTHVGMTRAIQIAKRWDLKMPADIRQRLKENWHMPGAQLIETCFKLDSEAAHRFYQEWETIDSSRPLPLVKGSVEVLRKLRSGGLKIFLLSSRNRKNLMYVLNYFRLVQFFDFIQAKDDWMFVKPDPLVFFPSWRRLSQDGIDIGNCFYIGDTPADFRVASQRGVIGISALTGLHDCSDFLQAGQKRENIISSIADLPEWIERYQDC